MDRKLFIIRHLYGEEVDRAAFRALLRDEDGFKEEHDALSEVKFRLDHRKRVRPDSHVIDRIAAAAQQGGPSGLQAARPDRAPVRRGFHGRRVLGLTSAALTLLLAAGIGLWQVRLLPAAGDLAVAEHAPAQAPQEDLRANSVDPTTASGVRAPALKPALPAGQHASAAASGRLAWDDADEVRRLRRHIEMLEVRAADLAWDEPVMTPEMLLPEYSLSGAGRTGQGLSRASQQRYPGDR